MNALSEAWIARARAVPIEREIERRGIKLRGAVERCGACANCGGTDRFSINTKKQCWNCRNCDLGGDVIALVQHLDGVDFIGACTTLAGERRDARNGTARQPDPQTPARMKVERAERERRAATEQLSRVSRARWWWSQGQPIAGSVAERYLREARGFDGPIPPTLAYLPPRGGRSPGMIAAFGFPDEPGPGELRIASNAVRAVHITRLLPDGSDRERGGMAKIMIGLVRGTPIVLAPANDLGGVGIVEGIEDGLAVLATGLGVWVAGAAGFMPVLAERVPVYVETITIYSHDDNAGQAGARTLAEALQARGLVDVLAEGLR